MPRSKRSSRPTSDRDAANDLNRRTFLKYVGAGAGTLLLTDPAKILAAAVDIAGEAAVASTRWVHPGGTPAWLAPAYPVPLPGDPGGADGDRQRLASYEVIDDLVLPEGFRYDVVASFGDVFGPADQPEKQFRFGYNCDYTGLVPIEGAEDDSDDQYWLMVNHEYVSARPWLDVFEDVYGTKPPHFRLVADHNDPPLFRRGIFHIDDFSFETC